MPDLDKLQQQAQRYKDLAERQLAEIARDQYLSPEGRQAKMASVLAPCRDALAKLHAGAVAQIATERRQLEERMWSDPANNVVGWRDAQSRADALGDDDRAKAQEMYLKARLSGDSQLAKALYLSRFGGAAGDDVPAEWAAAAEALAAHDAEYGSPMFKMSLSMLTSPPAPAELANVSPWQLDSLAASEG